MNGLDKNVLSDYVERIFLFARSRTYSFEEAEDLAQEILLEACKNINSLRNESLLEPWLWGLANNALKVFRRKQGKQKVLFLYDATEMLDNLSMTPILEDDGQYEHLRRKLITLSSQYREILILYYYDGMSCPQIADHLGIPEGTVKWRLSEGRSRLKKEWNKMTESALKPKSLDISISGNGNYDGILKPFPCSFISDALSQNILWHAYEKPKSVEELSEATGVPAHYIEDCLANLVKREAVIKTPGGKYQTDFIIYTRSVVNYINSNGEKFSEKLCDAFFDSLDSSINDILSIGFYTAGRSIDELKPLFVLLAVKNNLNMFNPAENVPYRVRYDGFRWAYHAIDKDAGVPIGIGENCSSNSSEGGSFMHRVFDYGTMHRKMMYDNEISLCERIFYNLPLSDKDKETAVKLVKEGYLKRTNSSIEISIPVFKLDEIKKFNEIIKAEFADIGRKYKELTSEYMNGFIGMFPSHLHEDALRNASWLSIRLVAFILAKGIETGRLKPMPENSVCDVLVQWREAVTE